jgi:hypothetical protein
MDAAEEDTAGMAGTEDDDSSRGREQVPRPIASLSTTI